MKKNYVIVMLLTMLALLIMCIMIVFLIDDSLINSIVNSKISHAIMITSLIFSLILQFKQSYLLKKNIRCKKYIYLSYDTKDKEIAKKIILTLNEQLKDYFKVITASSIPLGNDIYDTISKKLSKSGIIIIIVSSSYLQNEFCQKEFNKLYDMDYHIVPIVTESFDDLSKLSKDISDIKALSLIDPDTFSKSILELEYTLIKLWET